MTKNIKIPAFPTHADVREHIDTVIVPEIGRIGVAMDLAKRAINTLAQRDTGNTLATLVAEMIEDGATPTPEQLADAAQDSSRHYEIQRVMQNLDITRQNIRDSRTLYPTGQQNEQTLDYLSGVMDQIAAAARALPADTPLNAEDAITYGDQGVELLNTVQLLVGTYGEVRRAQRKAYGNGHEALNMSGHLRDAVNVEAYWLRKRQAEAEQYRGTLERGGSANTEGARAYFQGTPTTPWEPIAKGHDPTNATNNDDYARFILWAARNTELWVPPVADLEQQHKINDEITSVHAWVRPEDRRRTTQADIDQALATVNNHEPANA